MAGSVYFHTTRNQLSRIVFTMMLLGGCAFSINAQKAYFIDGFHGGVWGHYPVGQTKYMVDMLRKYPEWKINIEIEPETWDQVKINDSIGYVEFKELFRDQSYKGRIENINPSYAQSYLYNISGESIIRQFSYGIADTRRHFPEAVFTTYSSEEPCFTSALPQLLKSFGYNYASLKNPNTCWGGYTRAYGGELVNWIGPDGSSILTVPRYAIEDLQPNTTWRTSGSDNPKNFIEAAFKYGIQNPVGMTLQDAMWRSKPWNEGPWLEGKLNATDNFPKSPYQPTEYKIWRDYIANVSVKSTTDNWRLTQEDIQVGLVWGSQVLQKIAQQVRNAENKIVDAERMAAMRFLHNKIAWPTASIDRAWKSLLLAQHHDCWIVPYNGRAGNTWADKVRNWTSNTVQISDSIVNSVTLLRVENNNNTSRSLHVYNFLTRSRSEWIKIKLPDGMNAANTVISGTGGKALQFQQSSTGSDSVFVKATVPSYGYTTINFTEALRENVKTMMITERKDGKYIMETDLYRMVIDASKGGAVTSLIAKKLGNREFVVAMDDASFNGMRGNFYRDTGIRSSYTNNATVTVLENGPYVASLRIEGNIAGYPFIQTLSLYQGQERIDAVIELNWTGNAGIGNGYRQKEKWMQEDRRKAFYADRDKLLLLFPVKLNDAKAFRDAPFDVAENKIIDTYFERWDSIKNSILLNWVDLYSKKDGYGLAVLTDHTTSYSYAPGKPLGITVQYSGIGLWGRNYTIAGPTRIQYAIIPHKGDWKQAGLFNQTESWGSNLRVMPAANTAATEKSFMKVDPAGWQLTTVYVEGEYLFARIFNHGTITKGKIYIDGNIVSAELVELSGSVSNKLAHTNSGKGTSIALDIPSFGVRTIRISLNR